MNKLLFPIMIIAITLYSCGGGATKKSEPKKQESDFTGAKGEVKIMTVDPGHFHAALVQKSMYDQVSPNVSVYAPEGSDYKDHLKRIEGFNSRAENPTSWVEKVYAGADFMEKMISEKPGNVVVLSGNNKKKASYIKRSVEAGINVLADKPMVITPEDFPVIEEAFKIAEEKGVLLYDIMTERHEITTQLQKELSMLRDIFGELQKGTPDNPAVTKESVHHFSKIVSGNPIKRPGWFFDVEQQGEGIVDVTTHLVDLVQWECFPGQVIQRSDIEMLKARRWPTVLSKEDFKKVTQLEDFPEYLAKDIKNGKLNTFANGEMIYKIKDIHAKVIVEWKFEAPEGAKDTHYSIMRGTICDLIIRQGKEEGYKPTLYIEAGANTDVNAFQGNLEKAVIQNLPFDGLSLEKVSEGTWKLNVPDKYKVGHEAHFGQVTAKYLEYLKKGKLPSWEVPNMITKYYTTTTGLKMAKQ
jgi:predicted dehydrogenase